MAGRQCPDCGGLIDRPALRETTNGHETNTRPMDQDALEHEERADELEHRLQNVQGDIPEREFAPLLGRLHQIKKRTRGWWKSSEKAADIERSTNSESFEEIEDQIAKFER